MSVAPDHVNRSRSRRGRRPLERGGQWTSAGARAESGPKREYSTMGCAHLEPKGNRKNILERGRGLWRGKASELWVRIL